MAEPDKKPVAVEEKVDTNDVNKQNSESVKTKEQNKQDKLDAKKAKKDAKAKEIAKSKKAQEPKQNKVKETVAELKKVTWPTAGKVAKNTLLVFGIVLVFTIILFGIDYGLSWLYKLLTKTI